MPTAVAGFASVFGDKLGSLIARRPAALRHLHHPRLVVAVADLTRVGVSPTSINGLMSTSNLIALLLLSPVVIKVTKEHFAGTAVGIETAARPLF